MARGLCWDGGGGAGAGCGLRGLESAGRGCDVPWRSWWSLEASQRVPPAGRGGTSGAVHLGAEGRGRVAGRRLCSSSRGAEEGAAMICT